MKELRCRLPVLLQASDERVLQALAPSCEAYGRASFPGALKQVPEMEAELHPTVVQGPELRAPVDHSTVTQGPEVSAPAEALLITSQTLVASELAEAPLASAQAPEVEQPDAAPMPAEGPGALCTRWSGRQTTLRQVPPGGAPPAPSSAAPLPIPSTGGALAALHGGGLLALA